MDNMSYEVEYSEEHGVLIVRVLSTLTKNDVEGIIPLMNKAFEGKPHRWVLGDLSQQKSEDGMLDKSARGALMIAKIGVAVSGKSDITRFFKTEAEALKWLKGEK